MVVPLVYRDRLMGILALKEKLSGERFDRDDEALLSTLANQAALAIETALLHDEMTRQAELRRDLEIARDIQTSLLPRVAARGPGLLRSSAAASRRRWSAATSTTSSRSTTAQLGIVIGDVSGKSVPASLLMVASKEIVYSRALTTRDPGMLFQESNRRIYSIKRRMFVSLGYFLLDPDAMSLRYSIGGQPLPILIRSGRRRPAVPGAPGAPASPGRLPGGPLRHAGDVPAPRRPDLLLHGRVLRGDGPEMNPFGEERLMDSLAAHAAEPPSDEIAQGILADIRGHVSGAEQYDDMTFLFLRVE